MSISPSRWPGFWIIAGFWVLAAFGNYPAPFVDDLYYIGTAISLVKTGVYANPFTHLLWAAKTGPWELQLSFGPIESYLVAGWWLLFGINTLSTRVLFLLLAFANSLLLYRLMPKGASLWPAAAVICVAVFGMLGGLGIRPDAPGLFFLLLGLDVWAAGTPATFFLRNFALALSGVTYLSIGPASGLIALFGFMHLWFVQKKTIGQIIPFLLALALAWMLGFFLFLVCIHGQLLAFLQSVILNSHMAASGVWWRLRLFSPFGFAKWVVVQAAFLAVVLPWLWRDLKTPGRGEERLFLGFAVLVFLALGYSAFNSASGAHLWAFACLLTLLYLGLRSAWRWPAWLVYGSLFIITAFGNDHVALQHVLTDPMPSAEQRQALRREIDSANPQRVYVDEYALRELYGYDLPDNASDYNWSSTTGWAAPRSAAELQRNGLTVVSVGIILPGATLLGPAHEPKALVILGFTLPGVLANPYDLKVIDTR